MSLFFYTTTCSEPNCVLNKHLEKYFFAQLLLLILDPVNIILISFFDVKRKYLPHSG